MKAHIQDKFTHKNIRSFDVKAGDVLSDVVAANYDDAERVTVTINGKIIISGQWASTTLKSTDSLVLLKEPKAVAIPFILKAVTTIAVNYLVAELTTPEPDNYQTTAQGDSIYQAARGTNSPRLGSPPTELFGTFRNVPDRISPTSLHYSNNSQYRYILLSCGVGEYDFHAIRIADTDVERLPDIDITIFGPGEDVTSHPAHRHIYTSAEVGGTSSSEGLELVSGGYEDVTHESVGYWMPSRLSYRFFANRITAFDPVVDDEGKTNNENYNWIYDVGDIVELTNTTNAGFYLVSYVNDEDITLKNIDGSAIVFDYQGTDGGMRVSKAEAVNDRVMPETLVYDFTDGQLIAYNDSDLTPYDWPYSAEQIIKVQSDFNSGFYKIVSVSGNVLALTNTDGDDVTLTETESITAEIVQVVETVAGNWFGPYLACPEAEKTTTSEFDFIYRGGLGKENSNGSISSRTVDVEIQWREYGSNSAWNPIVVSKTAATRDDLADSITVEYDTAITPEVRVRRTTVSAESNTVRDSVQWQYLKSELPTAHQYPHITVMAIGIKIDGGIAASATNIISTHQQRKLSVPLSDGAWSEPQATNDVIPVVKYILDKTGHPESVFPTSEAYEQHLVFTERGHEVNGGIDTPTTLFPALKRVLQPAYSDLYLPGGKVQIVREELKEAYSQFFSDMNTHSIREIGTLISYNEFDGVRVEYADPDTGLPAYVDCVIDGSTGNNLQALRLLFCTNKTAAYRWGMRQAAKIKYLRNRYEVSTELEGLLATKGETCAIMHHDGFTGECYGYNSLTRVIEVRDDLEALEGVEYRVGIRKPDGKVSGPYPCQLTSDGDIQLVDDALDFVPRFYESIDNPYYLYGSVDDWAVLATVDKVSHEGGKDTSVTLLKYDERLFQWDDAELT